MEIEDLHDLVPKTAHQKMQEVTSNLRSNSSRYSSIKDKFGQILMESEDILERWQQCVGELYDDRNRGILRLVFDGNQVGPEILEKEIVKAVTLSKNRTAMGLDEISAEMLKGLGCEGVAF